MAATAVHPDDASARDPAMGRARLRPMAPDDLDAVLAVEVCAYPWPWSRGNFADTLAAGHWAQVLVDGDDALLGYVVAMRGAGELHLLNVTVAPARQGQGLGRRLLEALEDHARVGGAAEIWLEVRASNHRARALYLRHGYAEVGLRRQYYPGPPGRREDAVLMSRRVPDADPAERAAAAARVEARATRPGAPGLSTPSGDRPGASWDAR